MKTRTGGYFTSGHPVATTLSSYLGDQHFAGVCHAGVGMLFNIGRRTALRVEYRLYHISEPFDRADYGLNTHSVLFGFAVR